MTADMAKKARTLVIDMGFAQHQVAAILNVNPRAVNDAVHDRIFPSMEDAE